MTAIDYLDRWRTTGAITELQHEALAAIVSKRRFSVFLELNALLYLSVLFFVAGLGWTIHDDFSQLGDAAVIIPLGALFGACLYYCFSHAGPYTPEKVEAPTFAFDYVLYLGCLVFGVEFGYIELRFHPLGDNWHHYLLASGILYFILAYRFDNRFVLSLALSTLAGWFGLRFSYYGFHLAGSMRGDALVYSAATAGIGWVTNRSRIKPHFFESYLHVAANAAFIALTSGVLGGGDRRLWLTGLVVAAGVAVERGIRFRRFAFIAYGVVYGYIGVSAEVVRSLRGDTAVFSYFVASGTLVIILLAVLSRRIGREE